MSLGLDILYELVDIWLVLPRRELPSFARHVLSALTWCACKLSTDRKAYASVSFPSTLTVEPSRG